MNALKWCVVKLENIVESSQVITYIVIHLLSISFDLKKKSVMEMILSLGDISHFVIDVFGRHQLSICQMRK